MEKSLKSKNNLALSTKQIWKFWPGTIWQLQKFLYYLAIHNIIDSYFEVNLTHLELGKIQYDTLDDVPTKIIIFNKFEYTIKLEDVEVFYFLTWQGKLYFLLSLVILICAGFVVIKYLF